MLGSLLGFKIGFNIEFNIGLNIVFIGFNIEFNIGLNIVFTASVENLDMDNISRHGCGIWFLSGYMWEVLVAMG